MPEVDQIRGKFADVRSLLDELDALILEFTYVGNLSKRDPAELVEILAWIDEHADRLKLFRGVTESTLARVTADGETVAASGRDEAYERRTSADRKSWKHKELKAIMTEKVIAKYTDEEGTLNAPVSVIVSEVLNCAGINYWKVKELQALGVSPDKYSVKKPGKTRFQRVSGPATANGESEEDDDFI